MVKLYILLLVGCSLYLNGAADQPGQPDQEAILRRWSIGSRNLSGLNEEAQGNQKTPEDPEKLLASQFVVEANQVYTKFAKKSGYLPEIKTEKEKTKAVKVRESLLKLALDNLREQNEDTEKIMHLVAPLETGLRTYRERSRERSGGANIIEGASPRVISLWGKIRELDSQKNFKDTIFFQLAKERLKGNQDIQMRRNQLVELAKDALEANYDEMSLMIMRVTVAFDKGLHAEEMTNEVIDNLFKKAAADELEIGDEFSPRTQKLFQQINSSKLDRKKSLAKIAKGESLEQLF